MHLSLRYLEHIVGKEVIIALVFTSCENTVGKGEIACNKQFLPFPQCFFYTFGELSAIFIKFERVLSKCLFIHKKFHSVEKKIISMFAFLNSYYLTLYQTTKFWT